MSNVTYPLRDLSSFPETTNLNPDQAFQQTRKTKREDPSARGNGPQACKRAALGTITNNVGRIQPARAAKQAASSGGYYNFLGSENVPPHGLDGFSAACSSGFGFPSSSTTSSRPSFTIHVDAESHLDPGSSLTSNDHEITTLHPSVTCLPRQPLANLENVDLNLDPSPMLLDTSLTDNRFVDELKKETDIASRDNIYEVAEYSEEVFQYLREAELRNRPKPSYMKKQPDITASMRCILIDWLVEVAEEYKLNNETLYLSVSYIDRFLSQMSVLRAKLQLVGTASAFIAAKFEEIYPPELKEFVYITDDTYTAKQVLRMEHMILKVLTFDLAVPTINVFLPRYIKASQGDTKLENLSKYLAELSLQHYEFIKYLPSTIAASAVCLARHTLHQHAWDLRQGSTAIISEEFSHEGDQKTPLLCKYSGYELQDIIPCVQELHQVYKAAPEFPQQAVRDKYKSSKYNSISLTLARDEPPGICE